jgi:hypothetical protein
MIRARAFTLTLRPLPGVDGVRALRAALKILLRRFGLRVEHLLKGSGHGRMARPMIFCSGIKPTGEKRLSVELSRLSPIMK